MGHRDDLLVTRQYTRMTNAAGGPPTRSGCLLGLVQVLFGEASCPAAPAGFLYHRIDPSFSRSVSHPGRCVLARLPQSSLMSRPPRSKVHVATDMAH